MLQLYDEEWMEYIDIANTDTFSEIKDRAKLQVVLKNNVSFLETHVFQNVLFCEIGYKTERSLV